LEKLLTIKIQNFWAHFVSYANYINLPFRVFHQHNRFFSTSTSHVKKPTSQSSMERHTQVSSMNAERGRCIE